MQARQRDRRARLEAREDGTEAQWFAQHEAERALDEDAVGTDADYERCCEVTGVGQYPTLSDAVLAQSWALAIAKREVLGLS